MALGIAGVDVTIPVNVGLLVHMVVASIVGVAAYVSAAYVVDLQEGRWTIAYAVNHLRFSHRL
jgi:hypothetical protein